MDVFIFVAFRIEIPVRKQRIFPSRRRRTGLHYLSMASKGVFHLERIKTF